MERVILMHTGFRCLLGAACALLLGIAPLTLAGEASDRAALEVASQAWIKAFNAHDGDAMVALATEDVVLLDPSGAPVSGREAARKAWERGAAGQIVATTKESVIAGEFAWRIGSFTYKLPNGEVVNRGQSLEIWKRVDGQWQLHRQMPSSMLAMKPVPRPLPSEPILDTPRN